MAALAFLYGLRALGATSTHCSETDDPSFLLSPPRSWSGANQSSSFDSYPNAQSLLGHPAAVGFSGVQRGKGVLNPQLPACLLKDSIVGLAEVFEHLFPLVNAHQQIALVGFVLYESWYYFEYYVSKWCATSR